MKGGRAFDPASISLSVHTKKVSFMNKLKKQDRFMSISLKRPLLNTTKQLNLHEPLLTSRKIKFPKFRHN